MQAHALHGYRTQYANPIRFARGDVVTLGARDTEWSAFAWTTTADGNAGWAPTDWLQARDNGQVVALHDYCARELDVEAGDILTPLQELGGWWWCQHRDGRSGWLPADHLALINETTSEETHA